MSDRRVGAGVGKTAGAGWAGVGPMSGAAVGVGGSFTGLAVGIGLISVVGVGVDVARTVGVGPAWQTFRELAKVQGSMPLALLPGLRGQVSLEPLVSLVWIVEGPGWVWTGLSAGGQKQDCKCHRQYSQLHVGINTLLGPWRDSLDPRRHSAYCNGPIP